MGFLDKINAFDSQLLLNLNRNFSGFWDGVMYLGTDKLVWAPLFLTILYLIIKNKGRESILILIMLLLVVLFSDSVSTMIKEWTQRLRPSHNPSIMYDLHIVNGYRGGQFGFVSSHAANSFGLALFLLLLVRNLAFSITVIMWAAFHTFTRIYLGVHYPFDILCGALLGLTFGFLLYRLYIFLLEKFHFFKVVESDKYKISHSKGGFQLSDIYLVILIAIFSFSFLFITASKLPDFMS